MRLNWKPATAAIVAATALFAAGCSSSGEDSAAASDSATSGGEELRVASLGLGDVDTILALGVTPVTVAPWGAEGDVSESGVGPWSEELLGDARPEPIYNTSLGLTSEIFEQVAAAAPTQIIAVNQAVDAQALGELEKIAPTTVHSDEYQDWQVPWQSQVETIAEALDKESEGEALIDDTEASFAAFREAHPELAGKTGAMVMPYDGKLGLYTSGDGRGQFVESMGLTIPDEFNSSDSFFIDISPENYADLNVLDYLFVLDFNGAIDSLRDDPTFQGLDIVRDGKVFYLDTDTANAMSMPNPVTIPWALDKFDEAVS